MAKLDRGVLTINEVRALEGQDPVEWGDEPMKQSQNFDVNMANNPLNPNNPKPEEDKKVVEEKDKQKKEDKEDTKKLYQKLLKNFVKE